MEIEAEYFYLYNVPQLNLPINIYLYIYLYIYFSGAEDWTQGPVHAIEVVSHWANTLTPDVLLICNW